jgi:hypothetical protein
LFVNYFVHNVSATVSYDQKELLDIRIVIIHLKLDEDVLFNESDSKDSGTGPNPRNSQEEETAIQGTLIRVPCETSSASG